MNPSSQITEEERIRRENECKEQLQRYSQPTLMGHWQEVKVRREDQMKQYSEKRNRCETFLQAKNMAMEHLIFPGEIAKYNRDLLYNVPVQIKTVLDDPGQKITQSVLSATITEKQISNDNILELYEGCVFSASHITDRLRRNVFRVESCHSNKSNVPVLYGDDIQIRLHDSGSHRDLYVQCDVPTFETFGGGFNRFAISLSEKPTRYCKFKILSCDIITQDFNIGNPVPANSRVCISHTLSNRYLAYEPDQTMQSILGEEHVASGYNYRNIAKHITSENFWMFVTKVVGEDELIADAAAAGSEKK